jgi:hypothetical protein
MGADPYQLYLARVEKRVGPIAVGAYGKYNGKLVKKLAPHEFMAKNDELSQLSSHYQKSVARGDTLSDAMLKILAQLKAELLVDE